MAPIDIPAIEYEARRLRSLEIQHLEGILIARLRLYAQLLGNTVLVMLEAASETLRPLFAWNPQARRVAGIHRSLLLRINRTARGLFAWNPQHCRGC